MKYVKRRNDGLLIFERESVYFGMTGMEVFILPFLFLKVWIEDRGRKIWTRIRAS